MLETVPLGSGEDLAPEFAQALARISVNAIWVTSSKQPDDLIYSVTSALWNDNTRKLLDSGHAKGRVIRFETALRGLGIPLHVGTEKFCREKGAIK